MYATLQRLLFYKFQEQIENEWWEIDGVFTAVIAIVERAQATALQPLEDRRQAVEKEAEDLKGELEAEISELEKAIAQLSDIFTLDDHIRFLQVRGNLSGMDRFSADICFADEENVSLLRSCTTALC